LVERHEDIKSNHCTMIFGPKEQLDLCQAFAGPTGYNSGL
jgi:hypothetical protein